MNARTSAIAIGLCAVLSGASCGGSEDAADGDALTDASPVPTSADPSTTAGATSISPTTPATTTSMTISTTTTSTTPSTATPTTTAPATAAVSAAIEYCDAAEPLPVGAVLDSSLTLDIMGDGTADDLIEAWAVDGWSRLRLTTGANVVSEVVSSAVDGRYRPLGVASVLPGDSDELFAVVAEGSAATEIGVFGIDAADCLFSYTYSGSSDDFTMLIRPLSPVRSGALCFAGGIDLFSAEQRPDGTWDASSAAYEVAGPWTMEYRGGTDDFAEGLEESELRPFEFDCFGLSL